MDAKKKKDKSSRGLTQMDVDEIPGGDSADFICVHQRSSAVCLLSIYSRSFVTIRG
jgi:hypothetical protein